MPSGRTCQGVEALTRGHDIHDGSVCSGSGGNVGNAGHGDGAGGESFVAADFVGVFLLRGRSGFQYGEGGLVDSDRGALHHVLQLAAKII